MSTQPVDLSTPKKANSSPTPPPRMPLNPAPTGAGHKRSGSSIFAPSRSFDTFNAAGQPILDLHSALNGIQKSFTIGEKYVPY